MILLTILQTADEKRLTKQFSRDGENWIKSDYDQAYRFNAQTVDDLTSIDDLSALLTALEPSEDHCVIRAVPNGETSNIRRTLYADGATPATLKANPLGVHWLMLDFDKLPVGSLGLQTNEERLAHLLMQLPSEFHTAAFHYQWSSSAGLKGWDYLSCHLWFWLSEPWFCRDLSDRFREGDYADCGVDPAPFTPNQIHYTAAPIFENCDDPLEGIRSGFVGGDPSVTLTPWRRPAPPAPLPSHLRPPPAQRLAELLGQIGPNYHAPILRAVAHYVSTTPMDRLDLAALREQLVQAIHLAPAGNNPKRDYLDPRYLNRVIKGAARKFGRAA